MAAGAVAKAAASTEPGPTEREAWALLLAVDGLGPAGFGALVSATAPRWPCWTRQRDGARPRGSAGSLGRVTAVRRRPAARSERRSSPASTGGPNGSRSCAAPGSTSSRSTTPHIRGACEPSSCRRRSCSVRGAIGCLAARHVVALVGTRRPTERGRQLAGRIAGVVASTGAAVVSGLAVGIDGAAHAAVVDEGGQTAAVIGSGHRRLFPRAHQTLAERILATGGVVLSELWPDVAPATWTFPRRNRVISGLADATIVVEAGERSGALITARWALEQGRALYLVPGPIDEPRSLGCLLWLRDFPGEARIVARIPELIEDLGLLAPASRPEPATVPSRRPQRPSLEAILAELGATAGAVGTALVAGHGSLDELVAATGLEPATILGAITLLELRGLATSTYGRYRPAGQLASRGPAGTSDEPSYEGSRGLPVSRRAVLGWPRSHGEAMRPTVRDGASSPSETEQEPVLLRKVAAAALAIPVLAIIYLPVLARRPIAARLALLGTVGIMVVVAAVRAGATPAGDGDAARRHRSAR